MLTFRFVRIVRAATWMPSILQSALNIIILRSHRLYNKSTREKQCWSSPRHSVGVEPCPNNPTRRCRASNYLKTAMERSSRYVVPPLRCSQHIGVPLEHLFHPLKLSCYSYNSKKKKIKKKK